MSAATIAALRAIWDKRFAGLPWDCGRTADPRIVDDDAWRDWDSQPTTPDQVRIEHYLAHHDLRGRRILHVGIGNSSLAQRFAGSGGFIAGTTISPHELQRAEALALPGYRARLENKHAGLPAGDPGSLDFIADNNPTTFCCCGRHLAAMLDSFAEALAPGGQFVTDRVGLGWVACSPDAHPRWAFDFADLAAAAAPFGLLAFRRGDYTIVLSRSEPPGPGVAGMLRFQAHRLSRLIGRLRARSGPG